MSRYLLLVLSFTLGCQSDRQTDQSTPAEIIVKKSIEAHGGMDKWLEARELSFIKSSELFDATGNTESKIIQRQQFNLQPLSGTLSWSDSGNQFRIEYDGDNATKFINSEPSSDSLVNINAQNDFMSAHYVACQPFKLLDEGTTLIYQGRDTLNDNQIVDAVNVRYGGEDSDQWWYFFDAESSLLVANMVRHGSTYALIENLSYTESGGIKFNHHRKSWRVDSLRNKQFLRAEYFYDSIVLK
ncbi:MAG: hypothetical protein HC811_01645 [Flammeovirgaceae bacterium]|nr:hypothetical protein [Flammeovirgaceae bacterium]